MEPITKPTSAVFPPKSTMTTGRKLHVDTTRNRQRLVAASNRNWVSITMLAYWGSRSVFIINPHKY